MLKEYPESGSLELRRRPPALFRSILTAILLAVHGDLNVVLAEPNLDAAVERSEEQKIAEIERKFLELAQQVLGKMPQFAQAKMEKIMEVLRNRENVSCEDVHFGQKCDFKIVFIPASSVNRLRFMGSTRTLEIPDDFNPEDIGDMSLFLHELSHVVDDDGLRRKVSPQKYHNYWYTSAKTIFRPRTEVGAIILQTEFLDAAMNGELKARIKAGRPANVSTTNDSTELFLRRCAEEYYSRPPRDFQKYVRRVYLSIPGVQMFDDDLNPLQ